MAGRAVRGASRRPGLFVVLILAATASGCGDSGEPAAAGHAVVSWHVDDLEPVSLAEDADFRLDEDKVGFLAGTPAGLLGTSGLVVVADPGNHRILVLDSLGNLQRTIGRRGEGPLEFLELASMHAWPGDSVLAFDMRYRHSVFSPETGEGRTATFEGMMAPLMAQPGPEAGELWLVEGAHTYPGQFEAGRQRLPYSVVRWRPPDSVVQVASVAGPDVYVGPGGRGVGTPPVRSVTRFAAADGLLFVSEGAPELTVLDPTGATRLEVRVAGTGVALTNNEVRQRVTDSLFALVAITRVRMAKRLEAAPLPDSATGFDDLVLARDGSLWLGGRSIPGIAKRLWINLERDGSPLRRLRLPRSTWLLHADGDRLLLGKRDDLELYQVEVRRIVPQAGEAASRTATKHTDAAEHNGKSLAETSPTNTNGGSSK